MARPANSHAGGRTYEIFRLAALEKAGIAKLDRIPYSIKILLENLLRFEDGSTVKRSDIEYVAAWDPSAPPREINFRPARVLLQDFTGVPCVVDLAAMRDALHQDGRRSEEGESADSRGSGDRPFGASGSSSAPRTLSTRMHCSNISAIASATRFCAGGNRRFRISARCRRIPESCIR